MSAEYAEVLAVRRPVKIDNLLGVEIRDLSPGGTIQWLQPNVVDSVFPDGIDQRLSVGRELQTVARNARVGIEQARSCRRIQANQRYLVLRFHDFRIQCCSQDDC